MSIIVASKTIPKGIKTADVKRMRLAGMSLPEIANALNISVGTVSYHLAKVKDEIPAKLHGRLPVPDDVVEQMRRLRQGGFSNVEIAEKVGCHYATVYNKIGCQPKSISQESIRRGQVARHLKESVVLDKQRSVAVVDQAPAKDPADQTKEIAVNVLRFLAEVINQALANVKG